ncbi:unnamed protein product [Haemonchus placei]|uniref:YqaJ domain-containing protein n=1 Tax=Haemonchus placei TaxID=6290 RepID=A0A0N4WRV2_HAEPC|nr:unnamed protein product [Haemonchus placei]
MLWLCDNSDSSRGPFECSLDMSLSEVLERPLICCERTPIGWNEDPFFERDNNAGVHKQGYCRSITHFADFVTVSPELNLLEVKDRIGWNEDPFFERDNNVGVHKQGYCRSITHFADFVTVSPELNLLEMKDRVTNTLISRKKS